MKSFFFLYLYFNLALKGLFPKKPIDPNINGKMKNRKHAAVETGFPGNPKKAVLLLSFENRIGFPGLILTPLKKFFPLNFYTMFGT